MLLVFSSLHDTDNEYKEQETISSLPMDQLFLIEKVLLPDCSKDNRANIFISMNLSIENELKIVRNKLFSLKENKKRSRIGILIDLIIFCSIFLENIKSW